MRSAIFPDCDKQMKRLDERAAESLTALSAALGLALPKPLGTTAVPAMPNVMPNVAHAAS